MHVVLKHNTQCTPRANFWYGGWARLLPSHFDECAKHANPKIMSMLCGEL